jgi:protein unc-45
MASKDSSEHISRLVKDALESFRKGDAEAAKLALREASSIDPENSELKKAWETVQADVSGSELPDLCRKWIESQEEDDIEAALAYLNKHPSISDDALEKTMDVLMQYSGESDVADELTGKLLACLPAQKILARDLKSSPTVTFNKIFDRGDDSMNFQTDLLLDTKAWDSDADRIAAERDVFQLCLAQLMRAGQDFPERAMRAISRLLGAEAHNLNGLIDSDGFDVILSNLDIRCPTTLRSQASIACVKLLDLSPDNAAILISQYVVQRVEKPTGERLIQAFSAAASVFPMAPKSASELFLTAGFLPNFLKLLKKWKSARLEQAALDLLNAACMDPNCRNAIRKYCPEWLNIVTTNGEGNPRRLSQTTMANLVLEKIKDAKPEGENSPSDLDNDKKTQEQRTSRFKDLINDPKASAETKATALEGLAYASIKPWAKELLANDGSFLKSLVSLMASGNLNKGALYGSMSIIANITAYRPTLSEEQQKVAELKAFANSTKPPPLDPLDDEENVTARCKRVLNSGIVPLLNKESKSLSPAAQLQALQIINSLSKEKSHRGTLAQQGALKLLLQTSNNLASAKSENPSPAEYTAAHALARILISVNPTHAFTSTTNSPASAVRPLVLLLKPDEQSDGPRNLLPTFEALLALTNLASTDTNTCDTIIRNAWSVIEDDLLLNKNTLVQRAAVELICNLCASPLGASQFSGGQRASTRLRTLLALCDADDLPTRRAAAGALAMLTEWDAVVDSILTLDAGLSRLMQLLEDESAEVIVRGAFTLRNCVQTRTVEVKKVISTQENVKRLERVFEKGDPNVQSAIAEIVRALK